MQTDMSVHSYFSEGIKANPFWFFWHADVKNCRWISVPWIIGMLQGGFILDGNLDSVMVAGSSVKTSVTSVMVGADDVDLIGERGPMLKYIHDICYEG